MTRRGYHCRGQPGTAHGKPAVIGRQNRLWLPGQFAVRKRYRKNVSLKSGTTSSNPASSSAESAAKPDFRAHPDSARADPKTGANLLGNRKFESISLQQ